MARHRYIGWMVLCSDLNHPVDQKVSRAASEEEARELVRQLNAESPFPGPLYWCEWWSTSSQIEIGAPPARRQPA